MFSHHSLPGTPTPSGTKVITIPTSLGFAMSSIAPAIAVLFTHPLDVAKVHMQLQGRNVRCGPSWVFTHGATRFSLPSFRIVQPIASGSFYRGTFHCLSVLYSAQGLAGIQSGLSAAILREGSKNMLRIGLFDPILDVIHDRKRDGSPPLWKRMVAGALSGKASVIFCNPFEVLKTRMQAQSAPFLFAPDRYRYNSVGHGIMKIARYEGLEGFYRATNMSMLRSSFGSSINLAAYSYMHDYLLLNKLMGDDFRADVLCSSVSAFLTAVVISPIDLVRTRMLAQPFSGSFHETGTWYRSATHAFTQILKTEGPLAFYKGLIPNYMHIGPHFILTFVILEHMRRISLHLLADAEYFAQARAAFEFFDESREGYISRKELSSAIEQAYPCMPNADEKTKAEFERRRQRLLEDILLQCDWDHNNSITFNEFEVVLQEMRAIMHRCQWRQLFDQIDRDGSGALDRSEVLQALSLNPELLEKYEKVPEEEIESLVADIFQHGDCDGDGELSFEEFFALASHAERLSSSFVMRSWFRNAGVSLP
eukprot:TRINITY_DN23508_c0_g1_i1.p1 TRINITY_DN23508_c0_g1~~TRINITY_DN23508_c0_g1_i1.p1  ORF type:complete len:537 (+),score=122.48 TRINITY_DN23508_c0_g1_i1:263-1873(+)